MLTISALWIVPPLLALAWGGYQLAKTAFATKGGMMMGVLWTFAALYMLAMAIACCVPGSYIWGASLLAVVLYVAFYWVLGSLGFYFGLEAVEDRTGVESRMKSRIDNTVSSLGGTLRKGPAKVRDKVHAIRHRPSNGFGGAAAPA